MLYTYTVIRNHHHAWLSQLEETHSFQPNCIAPLRSSPFWAFSSFFALRTGPFFISAQLFALFCVIEPQHSSRVYVWSKHGDFFVSQQISSMKSSSQQLRGPKIRCHKTYSIDGFGGKLGWTFIAFWRSNLTQEAIWRSESLVKKRWMGWCLFVLFYFFREIVLFL